MLEFAGEQAEAVLKLLNAGLYADPKRRATAGSLLQQCKKVFALREERPKLDIEGYRYDSADNGVRYNQSVFARLNPLSNMYM